MPLPTDILLAECDTPDGRQLLIAELDELTLTYTIIARTPSGKTRPLRRYVRALRDARDWANAYDPALQGLDQA